MTRPAGPSQLPKLGRSFFENFEDFNLVRYAVKGGTWDDGMRQVSFIVKAASFQSKGNEEKIYEAINFTASIHDPFTSLAYPLGERLLSLTDLVNDKGLNIIIHVICPSIVWLDPAKGSIDISPFKIENERQGKEHIIPSVVKTVCRREAQPGFDYKTLVNLTNKIIASYPKHSNFTLRQIFYRLVALHWVS